jgi:WD40 repeat protein
MLPESGPFNYPSRVAVHPTEPLVAVARFGYSPLELHLAVWLIDWRTGAARELSAPVWLSQLSTTGDKESPETLQFHPDGHRLHLSSRRGNAYSWNLDDPAAPAREEPLLGGTGPVAFRPDGRGFWKATGNVVRACDAGGRVLATRELRGKPTSIGYSADAGRLVVAVPDYVLSLDPDDLTDSTQEVLTRSHYTSVAVAAGGRGGVVGVKNELHWADFTLGRSTGVLDRGQDFPDDIILRPAVSPDGALVAVPREHSHSLQLFSTVGGQLVATVRNPERTHAPPVGFSHDGTRLFVGGQDRVRVFRVRPGAAAARAVGPAPVHGIALDPTGRGLVTHAVAHVKLGPNAVAATIDDLSAWEWNRPDAPKRPARATALYLKSALAHTPSFQPDGPWLSYGLDDAPRLWNTETGEHQRPAKSTDESGVFAPGGRLWRSGSGVTVVEIPSGRPVAAFEDTLERYFGGVAQTTALCAGDDGVLVGTATGLLNWLGPDGKRLGRWKGGDTAPTVAARRPGGPELFVGQDSGSAAVFRLPAGESVAAWEPHRGRVTAAVWLGPDDLLTGGADRQIHLWRWTGATVTRVWSVRTTAGVKQILLAAGGRVIVLEDNARGVGVIDVPRFHADLAALVPTDPLRLAASAPTAGLPPLPAALRGEPPAPATGLRAEYFSVCPGTDERVSVAAGFVPGLPSPAAVPPHPDLPTGAFVVRYQGFVQSAAAGRYTLTVSAGDEAVVWLDSVAVAMIQGEGEVALPLTGRPQRLRVEWTHGQGAARLSLAWKLTSGAKPPVLTPDRP